MLFDLSLLKQSLFGNKYILCTSNFFRILLLLLKLFWKKTNVTQLGFITKKYKILKYKSQFQKHKAHSDILARVAAQMQFSVLSCFFQIGNTFFCVIIFKLFNVLSELKFLLRVRRT